MKVGRLRRAVAAAGSVVVVAGVAPTAHAAVTIRYTPADGLTITGDGAANVIGLQPRLPGSIDPTPAQDFYFVDTTDPVVNAGGCVLESGTTTRWRCQITGTRAVGGSLGAGDDRFVVVAVDGQGDTGPITLALGDGKDGLDAGNGPATGSPITADGGAGDDTFTGGAGGDVLEGGAGDDSFFGQAGADTMRGGDGDDAFFASARTNPTSTSPTQENTPAGDVMDGGPGADSVTYLFTDEHVNVTLDGVANDGRVGEGDNVTGMTRIRGGMRSNTITGDAADNLITVSTCCPTVSPSNPAPVQPGGDDVVRGGPGDDTILTGLGDDEIFGEDGDDIVKGGGNDDTIFGGAGNDVLIDDGQSGRVGPLGFPDRPEVNISETQTLGGVVPAGNDTVDGGAGNDVIDTVGFDTVRGGTGNDAIDADIGPGGQTTGEGPVTQKLEVFAGDGDDVVQGTGGSTLPLFVDLGAGDDTIGPHVQGTLRVFGASGNDSMIGGAGADHLDGGAGNDSILPERGDDVVFGGAGNDTIRNTRQADAGADTINGGAGNDLIETNQFSPAFADTVDCGSTTSPKVGPDDDTVRANLVDTVSNCENRLAEPAGERITISVPTQRLAIGPRGRVPVVVRCLPRASRTKGCTGRIQLGRIGEGAEPTGLGPAVSFRIRRGAKATLRVAITPSVRRALRSGRGVRAQVRIVQPGRTRTRPHTTIRTLKVVKR